MNWIYKSENWNPVFPINSYGFIYRILFEDGEGNIYNYYGKKSFWKTKTLQPLKGYKRKRKSMVESDWRTYTGSCKEAEGMIPIEKEILKLCESKRDLTYHEEEILFKEEVLFDKYNLNANIGGRHFKDRLGKREGEWVKWYDMCVSSCD
jgi:hypothetical protein